MVRGRRAAGNLGACAVRLICIVAYRMGISCPHRVKRDGAALYVGKIAYRLPVGIIGAAALCRRPAEERPALKRERVGRQSDLAVVVNAFGRRHISGNASARALRFVRVILYRILVCNPMRVQRKRKLEIADLNGFSRLVVIFCTVSAGCRIISRQRISFTRRNAYIGHIPVVYGRNGIGPV